MESRINFTNIDLFLNSNINLIQRMFAVLENFVIKALLYLKVRFLKIDPSTGEVVDVVILHFPSSVSDFVNDLQSWLERHINFLNSKLDNINQQESGLVLDGIENVLFKISLLENHGGSGQFKLPKILADKTAVVSVQCQKQCFKYAASPYFIIMK